MNKMKIQRGLKARIAQSSTEAVKNPETEIHNATECFSTVLQTICLQRVYCSIVVEALGYKPEGRIFETG
jgi:hypothetical protein